MKDVEEAERAAREMVEQGKKNKFAKQEGAIRTSQELVTEAMDDAKAKEGETAEQKAQRERFERLSKISKGAGLR